MKKLFKIGCLGFMALVFLGVAIGMLSGGGDDTTETTKPTETTEPTKKEKPADPVKGERVTKANYESIVQGDALTGEGGMTIEEVVNILGEPTSKTETVSGDMKMDNYIWVKGFAGSTISIGFMNGKVSNKLWME